MANEYEVELTAEEEEWQRNHPLGSFEDPEGFHPIRVEVEDLPLELQKKARELIARHRKEYKDK